eukprot:15916150-Heterocapsa_arctica.AAC.1
MAGSVTAEGSILSNEHQMWMQIGSQIYPEYPIHSCSEAFYHLRKAVCDHTYIFNLWYRSSKHIVGIDTDKSLVQGSQG